MAKKKKAKSSKKVAKKTPTKKAKKKTTKTKPVKKVAKKKAAKKVVKKVSVKKSAKKIVLKATKKAVKKAKPKKVIESKSVESEVKPVEVKAVKPKRKKRITKAETLRLMKQEQLVKKWQALHGQLDKIETAKYNMKATFSEETAISHSKLGWGFILSNVNDRLEVLFEDGIKNLISNYKS